MVEHMVLGRIMIQHNIGEDGIVTTVIIIVIVMKITVGVLGALVLHQNTLEVVQPVVVPTLVLTIGVLGLKLTLQLTLEAVLLVLDLIPVLTLMVIGLLMVIPLDIIEPVLLVQELKLAVIAGQAMTVQSAANNVLARRLMVDLMVVGHIMMQRNIGERGIAVTVIILVTVMKITIWYMQATLLLMIVVITI